MNVAAPLQVTDAARTRAIVIACTVAASAFGIFAALESDQVLATTCVLFALVIAAFALPLPLVALSLAALIPWQIYLSVTGTVNLRGALGFVVAAALRVMIRRIRANHVWRWPAWMIPTAMFMSAAASAAIFALNRYAALKGLYDWLPVFASAFVIGEIAQTERLRTRIVAMLIAGGIAQAILGLVETTLGLNRVTDWLQSPIAMLFFQPNLLRERLADMSFNWVLDHRVVPFGTFINGIDYAVFIAAILAMVIALLIGRTHPQHSVTISILALGAILLGTALLLTFKGTGMIALASSVAVIVLGVVPRMSRRTLITGAIVLGIALIVAAPFADSMIQRGIFLIQRELGTGTAAGRTAIWAHLLSQLPARPWFGFGLNNAISLVQVQPSTTGGAFVFNTPSPESAYVAALIETGIVGFTALLGLISVVLARAWRNVQTSNIPATAIGILAAIVAILCGNLTATGLTTDQNGMLLGVLIGLVFATADRHE